VKDTGDELKENKEKLKNAFYKTIHANFNWIYHLKIRTFLVRKSTV